MLKLTVDGIEVEVEPGATVLQACEEAGAEIPRFCYHERLSIAGNCRMCLVQIEGGPPKPAASCAMPVADGMVVHTKSEMVKKAREGAMEFLLINHPLDCPICDQGGECDLQDQSIGYGADASHFGLNKRAVEEKDMGPLIKTTMTRCIHCTRCIRFSTEVAGVEELGAIGRGEDMEVTTYLEGALTSELSGNVIDLCPVGALTSKPYAFHARPWELCKTESIDVMDAVGANIRVDARGSEVMRVLPRVNDDVNEEWITDKTRFIFDGLNAQRLDTPYVREGGNLQPATWDHAFSVIKDKIAATSAERMAAIAGDLVCTESLKALKDLWTALGSANIDCRQDGAKVGGGSRSGYLFNTGIAGIEQADALLLIGTNPRFEASLINTRIRKQWLNGGLKVGLVGEPADLTYDYEHLGAGPQTLKEIAAGTHAFCKILADAQNPMLIVGMGALARADGGAVLAEAAKIAQATGMARPDWNGFNVLHTAAARVAGLDLGVLPGSGGLTTDGILDAASSGALDVVFLLGADEIDTARLGKAFVIYQGSHGDAGAHRANVILPGAAYTEKDALWVSTEGRVQMGQRAVFPPGEAREDWRILRALSETLDLTLPYDTISALRASIFEQAPWLAEVDAVSSDNSALMVAGDGGSLGSDPFVSPIGDFYLTNPIARASQTMAQCSALFGAGGRRGATGTNG